MRYGSSGKEKSRVLILRIGALHPSISSCKSKRKPSLYDFVREKSLFCSLAALALPHWDTDAV